MRLNAVAAFSNGADRALIEHQVATMWMVNKDKGERTNKREKKNKKTKRHPQQQQRPPPPPPMVMSDDDLESPLMTITSSSGSFTDGDGDGEEPEEEGEDDEPQHTTSTLSELVRMWWRRMVVLVARFHASHNFLLVHSYGVGTVVLALFVMSLYWQLDRTNLQSMEYRAAAYFVYIIIALNLAFFQIAGVYVPIEYRMYGRERDDGVLSAYVFQWFMFLRDQWIIVLGTVVSFFPLYFGVGYRGGVEPVLESLLLIILFVLTMQGWAVKIQMALQAKLEHGLLAQGVWMGVNVMFAGFLVRLSDLAAAWSWLPYLMGSFWCLGPLMVIELTNLPMECPFGAPLEVCSDGNTVIHQLGYDNADVACGLVYFVVLIWLDRVAGWVAQTFWDTRTRLRIKKDDDDGDARVNSALAYQHQEDDEVAVVHRRRRSSSSVYDADDDDDDIGDISSIRQQRAQDVYQKLLLKQ